MLENRRQREGREGEKEALADIAQIINDAADFR